MKDNVILEETTKNPMIEKDLKFIYTTSFSTTIILIILLIVMVFQLWRSSEFNKTRFYSLVASQLFYIGIGHFSNIFIYEYIQGIEIGIPLFLIVGVAVPIFIYDILTTLRHFRCMVNKGPTVRSRLLLVITILVGLGIITYGLICTSIVIYGYSGFDNFAIWVFILKFLSTTMTIIEYSLIIALTCVSPKDIPDFYGHFVKNMLPDTKKGFLTKNWERLCLIDNF